MTIYSNNNQAQKAGTIRRRVSFDKLIKVKETLHVREFSDDEKQGYWLTGSEKQSIRRNAKCIVRKISSNRQEHNRCDDYYARGLEAYSPQRAQFRREMQRRTRQAVFNVQNLQRMYRGFNSNDVEEKIASAYKELGSICQIQARTMGLNDQLESFDATYAR